MLGSIYLIFSQVIGRSSHKGGKHSAVLVTGLSGVFATIVLLQFLRKNKKTASNSVVSINHSPQLMTSYNVGAEEALANVSAPAVSIQARSKIGCVLIAFQRWQEIHSEGLRLVEEAKKETPFLVNRNMEEVIIQYLENFSLSPFSLALLDVLLSCLLVCANREAQKTPLDHYDDADAPTQQRLDFFLLLTEKLKILNDKWSWQEAEVKGLILSLTEKEKEALIEQGRKDEKLGQLLAFTQGRNEEQEREVFDSLAGDAQIRSIDVLIGQIDTADTQTKQKIHFQKLLQKLNTYSDLVLLLVEQAKSFIPHLTRKDQENLIRQYQVAPENSLLSDALFNAVLAFWMLTRAERKEQKDASSDGAVSPEKKNLETFLFLAEQVNRAISERNKLDAAACALTQHLRRIGETTLFAEPEQEQADKKLAKELYRLFLQPPGPGRIAGEAPTGLLPDSGTGDMLAIHYRTLSPEGDVEAPVSILGAIRAITRETKPEIVVRLAQDLLSLGKNMKILDRQITLYVQVIKAMKAELTNYPSGVIAYFYSALPEVGRLVSRKDGLTEIRNRQISTIKKLILSLTYQEKLELLAQADALSAQKSRSASKLSALLFPQIRLIRDEIALYD